MSHLRALPTPIKRDQVHELVARYMQMSVKELKDIETRKDEMPVYEYAIAKAVQSAVTSGNYSLIDSAVKESLAYTSHEAPTPADEIQAIVDSDEVKNLDLPKLQGDLAQAVYVSGRLMSTHAVYQHKRVAKLRGVIDSMESKLFSPDVIARMPERLLVKLYSSASENMTHAMHYVEDFNKNVTAAVQALGEVERIRTQIVGGDRSDPRQDAAVAQARGLIQQKIKEKLAVQQK